MNFTKCQLVLFSFILVLSIVFFLSVYIFPTRDWLGKIETNNNRPLSLEFEEFLKGGVVPHQFSNSDLNKHRKLNFEGDDVLVYLHVQKTGGSTFGKHLVHNLQVDPPCKCKPDVKKCECFTSNNRIWLVSRHSTGWVCGLHADWTELNDCVDEWFVKNDVESRKRRRYHYISFIRNPVDRFFSEWQHVMRGATWKAARLHCNGRSASIEEVPFCYKSDDWKGVTFEEFIACKHNLAFNRITRMMADMSKVNCYNHTGLDEDYVDKAMLTSAMDNLLSFAFFGLLEFQSETQFLFERTFGINFIENFEQRERTHVDRIEVSSKMREKVIATNKLDIHLYQFAKDLFLQRVAAMEEFVGYTVAEYFDHIRDGGDAERVNDEELFEDESTKDAEEGAQESYPSKSKNSAKAP